MSGTGEKVFFWDPASFREEDMHAPCRIYRADLEKRMLFCYLGNSVTNIGSFVYSLTYKHVKTTLSAQEVIKVFLLATFYSFKKTHKPPNSKLFSLSSD